MKDESADNLEKVELPHSWWEDIGKRLTEVDDAGVRTTSTNEHGLTRSKALPRVRTAGDTRERRRGAWIRPCRNQEIYIGPSAALHRKSEAFCTKLGGRPVERLNDTSFKGVMGRLRLGVRERQREGWDQKRHSASGASDAVSKEEAADADVAHALSLKDTLEVEREGSLFAIAKSVRLLGGAAGIDKRPRVM
ncbi:hypothetical protein EDD85DRAFT_274425 [Armillaria nabsnona]|nr:hypothetical protein EDD85DRAFT_274425 [Armillaria nabsnona]